MPVDPRPPIGGPSFHSHAVAPLLQPGDAAARGFGAALAEAGADPAAAASAAAPDPVDIRGMDARDRTQRFVHRQPARETADGSSWLFGEDGFGFDDLVDVINPLQHIPIVSSIYRWITGDEISPASRMAGGALFGGPIGLAGSVASVVVDEATGGDLGEHAVAMVFGDGGRAESGGSPPESVETVTADRPATPAASQLATADAGARFLPLAPARGSDAAAPFIPVAARAPAGETTAAPPPAVEPQPADRGLAEQAGADTVEAVIAAEMMLALDKYEALMRSRAAAQPATGPAAGSLFDSHI